MFWLTLLLVANSAVEYFYIWMKIVKPKLEPIVLNSSNSQGADTNNNAGGSAPPAGDNAPSGTAGQTAYQDPALAHDMT